MESGEMPVRNSPEPEIDETNVYREIDNLPERLGFLEPTELKLVKAAAIDAHHRGFEKAAKELRDYFQLLGEDIVIKLQGEEYTKAQIGLMLALGNLRRDSGKVAVYVDDLEDALTYAIGMGYDEIIPVLEKAKDQGKKLSESMGDLAERPYKQDVLALPSHEIAAVLTEIGEEHGFDRETCMEIAAMPFEEAYQTAYGYLTQAGLDADKVLSEFTEN